MELYVPKSYVKLYSNTKQSKQTLDIISKYISNNCTITDATAGIGGNSKLFSKYFQNLNCVEIYDYAFKILKQNLNIQKYIMINKNLGFAKACNYLLKNVTSKYCLLTQADIVINLKSIKELLKSINKIDNCIISAPTLNKSTKSTSPSPL